MHQRLDAELTAGAVLGTLEIKITRLPELPTDIPLPSARSAGACSDALSRTTSVGTLSTVGRKRHWERTRQLSAATPAQAAAQVAEAWSPHCEEHNRKFSKSHKLQPAR